MSKTAIILTLGLILLIAFESDAQVQIAKEGTLSYTISFSGTFKDIAMGQERLVRTYELLGVTISDTGDGPLHNSSVRCVGAANVLKGNLEDDSGLCVFNRPDGDQIFAAYKTATGKIGVAAKGTSTFVGGTGKMIGIDGSNEWTRVLLRPAAEGTFQGYNRVKGNYKLP
mgnify:CR=1 FL=1